MREWSVLLTHGHLKVIKDHYKQDYAHKVDNLSKVNQLLERHKLPKTTQGELSN